MIKRLLTIYLPAVAVLTTATLAAVFLYNDVDPELEKVEFVVAENAEEENTDRIAENAEELRIDETEPVEFVDTSRRDVSTGSGTFRPEVNRDDIRTTTIEQIEPVVITVSGPSISIRCEINPADATTVHQVMQQAAKLCDFSYQIKKYELLGVFVDGIGGVLSDKQAGRYWIFSVNGTKANVGVSSYQIQPGDSIAWNYEAEY